MLIQKTIHPWLNGDNSDDSIELLNFQKPFRRDRGPEKNGGWVVGYIKENMYAYRRPDLEVNGLELFGSS